MRVSRLIDRRGNETEWEKIGDIAVIKIENEIDSEMPMVFEITASMGRLNIRNVRKERMSNGRNVIEVGGRVLLEIE